MKALWIDLPDFQGSGTCLGIMIVPARSFALIQWNSVQKEIQRTEIDTLDLLEMTYKHFYRLTNFDTANAIKPFQKDNSGGLLS